MAILSRTTLKTLAVAVVGLAAAGVAAPVSDDTLDVASIDNAVVSYIAAGNTTHVMSEVSAGDSAAEPAPASPYIGLGGACVKTPARAPVKGSGSDLYTVRVMYGRSLAESNGEDPRRPGRYWFKALGACHPKGFKARYDYEGNAHLEFELKDRRAQPRCDIDAVLYAASDGLFRCPCVYGTSDVMAQQWSDALNAEAIMRAKDKAIADAQAAEIKALQEENARPEHDHTVIDF